MAFTLDLWLMEICQCFRLCLSWPSLRDISQSSQPLELVVRQGTARTQLKKCLLDSTGPSLANLSQVSHTILEPSESRVTN